MNISSKYLFLAAALVALAACDKDETRPEGSSVPVEIRLTSSLEAQTRATHGLDTQIAEGETVHVWVDNANTGASLYEDNILTVDGSGALSGGDSMYFPSSGHFVDIYAIHGSLSYDSFWEGTVTHAVAADQKSSVTAAGEGYAGSDLVYCEAADVARTTNAIELTFKHLLSKVEVVLVQGDGSPGIVKMEILNTQLEAALTPVKGSGIEVTPSGSTGSIDIDIDLTEAGAADADKSLNEAIIVPQVIAAGTQLFRATTDEGGELYYALPQATTFESGKKYRYTVTASLTGLTVTSAVTDWTSGADDTSGTASQGVAYTTDADGTRTYTVTNEAGLLVWAEYTNAGNWSTNCTLAADITLTAPVSGGSNWTAVGDYSNQYAGTFDGNGYTISGLTISTSSNYQGLIGCLDSGGEVKNLTMTGVSITGGNSYIGSVVGYNSGTVTDCSVSGTTSGYSITGGVVGYNYGTVTNCYSSATVNGSYRNTGGIVGYNWYGTITNCQSSATVNGSNEYAGGVVGFNTRGPVTACYATGSVSGYSGIGGVVGYNTRSAVTACYSTATVNGTIDTGGVVGCNHTGTVTACYATGSVSGSYDFGGVVGYNYNGGTASTCYWKNGVSYGISNDTDSGSATYVDGTSVTWSDSAATDDVAMSSMNEALTTAGYAWQYVANDAYDGTDTTVAPLLLEAATAAEGDAASE